MRRSGAIIMAAGVALLLSAGAAFPRVIDGVVALVNEEPVTFSEVRESVSEGMGIPVGDADALLREERDPRAVLRWIEALVDSALVRKELEKLGQSVAQAEIDKAIKEAKGTPATTVTTPRMIDVVDDYLAWVQKNQAAMTYRNKSERLPGFIMPALGKYRVQDLNQRILDQYGETLTRAMYRYDIVHLMALIRWMVKRQYAVPLTWKPELPTIVSKIKPLPSPADIMETINAVASETCRQLFLLQIYTGLRPIEIKRLRWEDYRHDCFVVQHTKTHEPIVVPIPEHLQEWYTQHERESGWVFESSRRKGSTPPRQKRAGLRRPSMSLQVG